MNLIAKSAIASAIIIVSAYAIDQWDQTSFKLKQARQSYLEQNLPYLGVYERANRLMPKDARFLLVGNVTDQYNLKRPATRLDPLYGDSVIPWHSITSVDGLLSYIEKRGVMIGIWKVGTYHSLDQDCYNFLRQSYIGRSYDILRETMEHNTFTIYEENGYRIVGFLLPKHEVEISTAAPYGGIWPTQKESLDRVEGYHNLHK